MKTANKCVAGIAFILAAIGSVSAQTPAGRLPLEPPGNDDTGISIDRYIGNAANSPTHISHETMYVQRIFGSGNFFTGSAGMVLAPGQETDLATLLAHDVTSLYATPKELIFYVESGKGRLDDGKQFWDLSNGIGATVPANIAHRLTNTGDEPLKMVMFSFDPYKGSTPLKSIVVRDSHKLEMMENNVHWQHNSKLLFGPEVGVGRVLVITFGPMTIAGPHASALQTNPQGGGVQWIHVDGGDMLMQLGSEIRHWPINSGFVTPENGQTVHGRINVGDTVGVTLFISGGGLAPIPPPTPDGLPRNFWHTPPLKGEAASATIARSFMDAVVAGRPMTK